MTAGDRKPPQALEAEQAVLGSVMVDNGAVERVGVLQPGDFHAPEHGAIWRSVLSLAARGQPIDVVTLHEEGQHELPYLLQLQQGVPSAANVGRYAGLVRDRAIERAMIAEATAVIELADAAGMTVEQKVDQAQARMARLSERKTRRDPTHVHAATAGFLDHLTAVVEGRDRVISTGLTALDRLTAGGIRPGDLWVIGARPSMGKTALSLSLQRAMSRDYGTLFLSQEMPVLQLTMRHVAAVGGINLADLRKPGDLSDDGWSRLTEAADRMRVMNLVMDDQGALSVLDVRRKVMHTKRLHGLDVLFVDYLQLMAGDGENRNQELDRISNGLKALALEFEIGVVLLSQLSRRADERSGPPVMADLRDSGAIEAAADLIGMLHRDFVRNPSPDNKHHAQLEVVKQRAGPPGTAHLWFDGAFQRFGDWPDGEALPKRGSGKRGNYEGMD